MAKLHAPLPFTVAVPSCVVPLNTVTVLFASAVPVRVTTLVGTTSPLITGAFGMTVSICGPVWVRPVSDRLAALPAPSVMVAPLRLMVVADSDATLLSLAADRVAESQRTAGAAGIGRGAAVVER